MMTLLHQKFSKAIIRLFRERQIGDYEFDLSTEKDEAKEDLEIATTIVKKIAAFLVKEGFLCHRGQD